MVTRKSANGDGRNASSNIGIESGNSGSEKRIVSVENAETDIGTDTGTGTGPEKSDTTGNGKRNASNEKRSRDNETVNPAAISSDDYARDETGNIIYKADGVTPAKKRGRKRGQTSAPSAPSAVKSTAAKNREAIATEMLAAQFQILNTGIAYLTKFEDWKLDDSEANEMAKATSNFMAQFDVVPDPKITAALSLVTTASMIYGPRVYLYRQHINKVKTEKDKERVQNIRDSVAINTAKGVPSNSGQFNNFDYGGFSG